MSDLLCSFLIAVFLEYFGKIRFIQYINYISCCWLTWNPETVEGVYRKIPKYSDTPKKLL